MSDNENTTFALPEGRLINGHLFVRSIYKDKQGREGKPKYSVEMAYPSPAEDGESILSPFEDYLWNIMVAHFGEEKVKSYDEKGWVRWPIKDGDKKAIRREADGSVGDAYKGMDLVSASSLFNYAGNAEAGGVDVYNEAVELLSADGRIITIDKSGNRVVSDRASTVPYNGCMGVIAVKAKGYDGTTDNDDPFISCVLYLEAFQMTGEGQRLSAAPNRAGLFQKRAKAAAPTANTAASGTRRTRS